MLAFRDTFTLYEQGRISEASIGTLMARQYTADTDYLLSNGCIAPWDINAGILDDDEAAALTYAADHIGIVWSDTNKRTCAPTIAALNMRKKGNTAFILRKLREKGWLSFKDGRLMLTQRGQWVLDLHEANYDGPELQEGVYTDMSVAIDEIGGLFG